MGYEEKKRPLILKLMIIIESIQSKNEIQFILQFSWELSGLGDILLQI